MLFLYIITFPVLKLPFYLGSYLATPQILGISLIFVLLLHFLTKRRWIDLIPLILALPGIIFITFFYEQALDYEAFGYLDGKGIALSFSLATGLIVVVYRRTGWAMPSLILVMLLIVRFQGYLPGLLHGQGYEFSRLGFSFYLGTHGIFGVPFRIASTILISFIVFGRLFEAAGGGKWFLDFSSWILGSAPGGRAKVAVMASAFFGMISGSPSANTASTGAITIPMMIRTGYSPALAGAIEAVASTGGQFMPPVMGAIIFIMAEWLEMPYSSVALKAAIPAILYYVIVFSTIHFEALRSHRSTISRAESVSVNELLRSGWIYVISLAALVIFLLALKYDPENSVLLSMPILAGCSFLSPYKETRLYPRKIYASIVLGVQTWVTIAAVTATVGILIGALTLSGLGVKISDFLIEISGGNLVFLLFMVGLASFVLGMGLDSIPCYITVAILTAPALMKFGISDFAAHLFVIYWGLASFFTPPVCLAVFVACGISGATMGATGLHAIRLGIGVFLIPMAFALHPALLLQGSPSKILLTVLTATIASVAVGCATAGYCLRQLNWAQRSILLVGAIAMILPGYEMLIGGLVLIAASVGYQYLQKRANK